VVGAAEGALAADAEVCAVGGDQRFGVRQNGPLANRPGAVPSGRFSHWSVLNTPPRWISGSSRHHLPDQSANSLRNFSLFTETLMVKNPKVTSPKT
jgi:hypothetical protein